MLDLIAVERTVDAKIIRACVHFRPCRVTLSRLVPYFSRLKSRISRTVAQK
eukprot:SAG31_NODE_15903_length_732_cov_2.703002_1_plen_50_part_01